MERPGGPASQKPFGLSLSKGSFFLPVFRKKGRASTGSARTALGFWFLLFAQAATAQQVTTSPAPSAVSVTIYRAPQRTAAEPIRLDWLNGYALITETRTITFPAGTSDIRFEGVAGGILPESAIVSGLPDGVAEKNQDAFLLSPASLLDQSLGRRVHLRRTSRATGAMREEEAVVRSGADGAVVVQTAAGFEALRCTGLPETIRYDRVPPGLSAKPTLSVRTEARRRTRATLTLSYLASGFNWQANYVGALSPDGTRMDLFAWVTLASGDETSFPRANTQAVAGRLNRTDVRRERASGPPLRLNCFPLLITSDIPERKFTGIEEYSISTEAGEEIVVTGSRVSSVSMEMVMPAPPPPAPAMMAEQEELGDLKLYRIPEPVTVAAMSQKQVALLLKRDVAVTQVYRINLSRYGGSGPMPARRVYTSRNRIAEGLGVPLPAGRVALFGRSEGRRILVGEGSLGDRAVGEDVEIEAGAMTGVLATAVQSGPGGGTEEHLLTVTNDRAEAVTFEAEFGGEPVGAGVDADVAFARRNGRPLWRVAVPANGRVALRYRWKS